MRYLLYDVTLSRIPIAGIAFGATRRFCYILYKAVRVGFFYIRNNGYNVVTFWSYLLALFVVFLSILLPCVLFMVFYCCQIVPYLVSSCPCSFCFETIWPNTGLKMGFYVVLFVIFCPVLRYIIGLFLSPI